MLMIHNDQNARLSSAGGKSGLKQKRLEDPLKGGKKTLRTKTPRRRVLGDISNRQNLGTGDGLKEKDGLKKPMKQKFSTSTIKKSDPKSTVKKRKPKLVARQNIPSVEKPHGRMGGLDSDDFDGGMDLSGMQPVMSSFDLDFGARDFPVSEDLSATFESHFTSTPSKGNIIDDMFPDEFIDPVQSDMTSAECSGKSGSHRGTYYDDSFFDDIQVVGVDAADDDSYGISLNV